MSEITKKARLDEAVKEVETAIITRKAMQTKRDEKKKARFAFDDARELMEALTDTKKRAAKAMETMHSWCDVNKKRMMHRFDALIEDAEVMYANADNVFATKETQSIDSEQFHIRSNLSVRAACAAAGMSVPQVYDVYYSRIGHTPETIALVVRMVKEEDFDNAETDDEEDKDDDRPKKRRCP